MKIRFLALTLLSAAAGCSSGGSGSVSGPSGGGSATPTPSPSATAAPTPSPTATVTYISTFRELAPDGFSAVGLIKATDGNFYGVKEAAGANTCLPQLPRPCGIVIKVTPAGEESVLYAFGTAPNDGFAPGPLVQGKDGALYGVTTNGGTYGGGGTFFRLTLTGAFTSLHSFGGPSDGLVPYSLVAGSDGNFYGTTVSGGAYHCDLIPQAGANCGTVFKITPDGIETVLHSFGSSTSDGIEPQINSFIEGRDGNFYGTTQMGGVNTCGSGGHSCGTVFKITSDGTLTILHAFGASPTDGVAPMPPILQTADGAILGVTAAGGGGSRCGSLYGCGAVYKIAPSGAATTMYSFGTENRLDGSGPTSLLLGADGNFYGTTVSGGAYQCDSCGTVFRLSASGSLTVLHSFQDASGKPGRPGNLYQAPGGSFYGRLEWGNIYPGGGWTAFKLTIQ